MASPAVIRQPPTAKPTPSKTNKKGHSVRKNSDGSRTITGVNKRGKTFTRTKKGGKLISSSTRGTNKKGNAVSTYKRSDGSKTRTVRVAGKNKTRRITKDAAGKKTVTTYGRTKAGLTKTKTRNSDGSTSVTRARKNKKTGALKTVTKRSDGTKTISRGGNYKKGVLSRKVDIAKDGSKTKTRTKVSKNNKNIKTITKGPNGKRKVTKTKNQRLGMFTSR